jgi:hypothetical protein
LPDDLLIQGRLDADGLPSPVYVTSGLARELRQSEIISNIAQFNYDPVSGGVEEIYHEYAIILAQDCDLLWDFNRAERGELGQLNTILIYNAYVIGQFPNVVPQGASRAKILQNKDERYHYLEEVPANLDLCEAGMPGLLIDFKRYFSLTPNELYRQITTDNGAKRRCRLEMPYREHLQCRAAFYMQRVMIPVPHVEPPRSA